MLIRLWATRPYVRFSKLPNTFRARKAIFVHFVYQQRFNFRSFWKISNTILRWRETLHWFSSWKFQRHLKENFKNSFRARKVFGSFEKRTPGVKYRETARPPRKNITWSRFPASFHGCLPVPGCCLLLSTQGSLFSSSQQREYLLWYLLLIGWIENSILSPKLFLFCVLRKITGKNLNLHAKRAKQLQRREVTVKLFRHWKAVTF